MRSTNEKITQAPGRLVRPEAKVRELTVSGRNKPITAPWVECLRLPVGLPDRKHSFIC
jgi:hypothetical protein